jgi:hypothetical protein
MAIIEIILEEVAKLNSVFKVDLPSLDFNEKIALDMLAHRDKPENAKRIKQDSSDFAGTTGEMKILFHREIPLSQVKQSAKNLRDLYKEVKTAEKDAREKIKEAKAEALIEKTRKALARKK